MDDPCTRRIDTQMTRRRGYHGLFGLHASQDAMSTVTRPHRTHAYRTRVSLLVISLGAEYRRSNFRLGGRVQTMDLMNVSKVCLCFRQRKLYTQSPISFDVRIIRDNPNVSTYCMISNHASSGKLERIAIREGD